MLHSECTHIASSERRSHHEDAELSERIVEEQVEKKSHGRSERHFIS
jgi:hypothetical protein